MFGFFKKLFTVFGEKEKDITGKHKISEENETSEDNSTEINTERLMTKKTVITKILGPNTSDAIIEFPQNRTLIVEQLTDAPPVKAEMQKEFTSLQDIFEFFHPNIKNMEMEDMQGKEVKEDLSFNELKDFEPDNILRNSTFLNNLKIMKDSYDKIEQQLIRNKALRNALSDPDSRKNLLLSLQALLAELQQNK